MCRDFRLQRPTVKIIQMGLEWPGTSPVASLWDDSIATLRPNQLEFWKSVAYITSYDQKRHLPNQTKPAGWVWWVVYGGNKS